MFLFAEASALIIFGCPYGNRSAQTRGVEKVLRDLYGYKKYGLIYTLEFQFNSTWELSFVDSVLGEKEPKY